MRPTSYVENLIQQNDIDHFWLDHLEITFDTCSDPFIELAKKYYSDRWQISFRINEKSPTEYPLYFEVCRSRGYEKAILLKYNFKWVDDLLCEIHFAKSHSKFPNKAIFHWKFFRYCRLDAFDFSLSDLLAFIEKHFMDPQVREFHLCIDVRVDKKIADKGFLTDLYQEMRCLRFGNDTGINTTGKKDKHFNVVADRMVRTIYDGDPKPKNNRSHRLRIYDKTFEVQNKSELHTLYAETLNIADKITIFRFEVEFRPDVAKAVSFVRLKDKQEMFWMLLTQLDKSDVPVFRKVLNYNTVLSKRKKVISNLGGGNVYKIEKYNKQRELKTALTYVKKLKAKGIDVFAIDKNLLEEGGEDLWFSRREEFMMYYQNILDTITEFLKGGDIRYRDFADIISGHIDYLEKALWEKFEYFMNVIGGFIHSDLESFAKGHYKNLVLMAYIFYKHNIPLIDKKTLFFLEILDREKIMDFGDKHLKAEVKKLTSTKSCQFLLKQIDTNKNDPEFVLKLIELILKKDSYS